MQALNIRRVEHGVTSVGRASWLFVKQPHLNAIHLQGKALKKKYALERSGRGRFFLTNPQGTGLDGKWIVQKFAHQKGWGKINGTLTGIWRIRKAWLLATGGKERSQRLPLQGSG